MFEEAAWTDGRELLGGTVTFGAALGALPWPARLLTAPAGLFGEPPGLLPPELCATWLPQAPLLLAEEVPGSNHYTMVLDPATRPPWPPASPRLHLLNASARDCLTLPLGEATASRRPGALPGIRKAVLGC